MLPKLKNVFLKTLIGCLIAAAALAVVTILIGKFNDVSGKALITILLIAIHALVSFEFIVNNEKQDTFESLNVFTNAVFIIVVLSFITSILGVWGVVTGEIVAKLYGIYGVLLFATLHAEVLAKTLGKQSNIDKIVSANFGFMVAVVCMLLPIILLAGTVEFPPAVYRVLAAAGIVDATLTLIAVILHKLYIQKHPHTIDPVYNFVAPNGQVMQTVTAPKKRHMNIFVTLLLVYIGLQIIGGLVMMAVSFASN